MKLRHIIKKHSHANSILFISHKTNFDQERRTFPCLTKILNENNYNFFYLSKTAPKMTTNNVIFDRSSFWTIIHDHQSSNFYRTEENLRNEFFIIDNIIQNEPINESDLLIMIVHIYKKLNQPRVVNQQRPWQRAHQHTRT